MCNGIIGGSSFLKKGGGSQKQVRRGDGTEGGCPPCLHARTIKNEMSLDALWLI